MQTPPFKSGQILFFSQKNRNVLKLMKNNFAIFIFLRNALSTQKFLENLPKMTKCIYFFQNMQNALKPVEKKRIFDLCDFCFYEKWWILYSTFLKKIDHNITINDHNSTKNLFLFWFFSLLDENAFQKILIKWKNKSQKKKMLRNFFFLESSETHAKINQNRSK